MKITGVNCEGSLETESSGMKTTGVNCEGSIKNKEDKVILDSDRDSTLPYPYSMFS